MKRKILLTLLSTASIAMVFTLVNSNEIDNSELNREYFSKELPSFKDAKSWNDAAEYYNLIYRDAITGKVEKSKLASAKQQVLQLMAAKSSNLSFVEEGPDNVGGRTRAIAIDPNNPNTMFAGSVTGGLFVSYNAGANWTRVQEFDEAVSSAATGVGSIGISSIAVSNNGTLYVASGGSQFEGGLSSEYSGVSDADGIWYSMNLSNFNFQQVSQTNGADINKLQLDMTEDNTLYYAGVGFGLKKMVDLGIPTSVSGISSSGSVGDVKVSKDGQTIILDITQSGKRTFISNDGGNSFTDLHSTGQLSGFGVGRAEYAISDTLNSDGHYTLYALFSSTNGTLAGVHRSIDGGTNWCQIGPASTTGFAPLTSRSGQGNYDLVIISTPYGDACILGGIDLWQWTATNNTDCDNGQWYPVSNWALPPTNPYYIHADNHRLLYDNQYNLIVGNDGGVQKRTNGFGAVFNKGYNVTQFYAMAYGGDGAVMGGSQDNGTQYNDNSVAGNLEFQEVMGGDGFECEISYLDNEAMIASIYSGSVSRSNDKGLNWQQVAAPCSGTVGLNCGSFYTALRLFEDPMDMNTGDSIEFIPDSSMYVGQTVQYFSESFGIPLEYTLTQDLVVLFDSVIPATDSVLPNFIDTIFAGETYYYNPQPQDTIMVPDYVQSLYVTQGDVSTYITRDMMRFTTSPEWWKLFVNSSFSSANMKSFEFSKDGNYVWCGNEAGALMRVSGLDSAYTAEAADISYKPTNNPAAGQDPDTLILISNGDTITGAALNNINYDDDNHLYSYLDGSPVEYQLHTVKITTSFGGKSVTDISVDPTNPDNVCVVLGGTSGNHVYYSTNGTSASPTFTSIDGNLPDMPVFGCIVERDPSTDIIVIGTEYGVFTTDNLNGTSTQWTACNDQVGVVPVFDVRQQWRDWEDGRVNNPGAIYLGTHARGIWRSDNLLSIDDFEISNEPVQEIKDLMVYPNPVINQAKLTFDLSTSSAVKATVYDLNGRVIEVIKNENRNAGTHSINFNVSNYNVGTYFVLLETKTSSKVAKFIKY
tara:strand:+ start:3171 stop:6284 length:3114 start_codon:yes stop_codon:yes gene_type:complete